MQTNPAINTIKYHYIDIAKIEMTRLHGSRAGNGLWKGALIGIATGAIIGLSSGDDKPGILAFSAGEKAAILGAFLGLAGLLIGCLVGAFSKKKYKFNINGNKENFDVILLKLK